VQSSPAGGWTLTPKRGRVKFAAFGSNVDVRLIVGVWREKRCHTMMEYVSVMAKTIRVPVKLGAEIWEPPLYLGKGVNPKRSNTDAILQSIFARELSTSFRFSRIFNGAEFGGGNASWRTFLSSRGGLVANPLSFHNLVHSQTAPLRIEKSKAETLKSHGKESQPLSSTSC
jgi:hypothetical protein